MTSSNIGDGDPGAALARFAATVTIDTIPAPVLRRAEDLMLDWFGCALAGKGARPVESITRFVQRMGPAEGPSELLIQRRAVAGGRGRRLRGRHPCRRVPRPLALQGC